MRIVFATNNRGKAREATAVLSDCGVPVFVTGDLGIQSDPEENGETFGENARIKAFDVYEKLRASGEDRDTIVLADDSGLCIDYLNGEPGVRSARFMGHETSYTDKNNAILRLLEGVPSGQRGAAFVCHVCAICPDGAVFDEESRMEGAIAEAAEGAGGFGYDPIFYVPEYGKVSGLLTQEEKNLVSHRGKVLRKIREVLCRNHYL